MTEKEIKEITDKVESYLHEQRLRDAINLLKNSTEGGLFFELTDKVKQIEQTYAYMLKYLTEGAQDPQRDRMLSDLVAQVYDITEMFRTKLLEKDSPTLYYSYRRFNARQGAAASIENAILTWRQAMKQSVSMSSLFANASQSDNGARKSLETAEVTLFNAVWTSFPMKKSERAEITALINDTSTPPVTALRLTSAIGLAAMEHGDPQSLETLADIYTANASLDSDGARNVTVAALVNLVSALYRFSQRTLPNATLARIKALSDLPTWNRDVRLTFMELVRARDTERINRAMRDEIIPGVMALKPELEKKFKDIKPEDLRETDLDENSFNPEWEEILSKSGIGDKLKEFNELQMDGSDVFMSTFAHLKNFPFFNEVVNWFTKLTVDNPDVERIVERTPELADLVGIVSELPFLCDSDKFSILFSIGIVPPEQLRAMLGQIVDSREQLDELKAQYSGLTDRDNRCALIRNYLHNLYRFLNLFRRKSEFYNIFAHDINLIEVPLLRDALLDADLLRLIGEFYFKHKYYNDSLAPFLALDEMGEFDATLYQKLGYAYEQLGNFNEALRYYEQADLLDSKSRWLKIHLASTYRHLDRIPEALEVLRALNNDYPEDIELAKMTGYTYIAADNYREALKHFHRAEFIVEDDRQTIRAIAWSLFMVRELERAETYYNKLLLDQPSSEDYLNMGHVALALSKFKEAINYYKMFIFAVGNNKEAFFGALYTDREHLRRAGIKDNIISLIADAMLYDLDR